MCGMDQSSLSQKSGQKGAGNMAISQMLMKKHLCRRTDEGSSYRNSLLKRMEGNAATVPGHYDSV